MEEDSAKKAHQIRQETFVWMGEQLSDLKSEADRLAFRARRGEEGSIEVEIEELEVRLESYKSKLAFEKRNAFPS